jgi:signal transduction histidine kinase
LQFERAHYEQQEVGLRLAIVQRLVELNHGHLRIESGPQQTTTVHCILPLAAAAAVGDDEIMKI